MRIKRFALLCAVAFGVCVEAAGQAPLIGQSDIARPGGGYTTLRVGDAAACAGLCAADGICMAWTYLDSGLCELKAVVPPPVAMAGARSGLSSRAPEFARHVPVSLDGPIAAEPAAVLVAHADNSSSLVPEAIYAGDQLLGGPDPGDANLRPRLGDNR